MAAKNKDMESSGLGSKVKLSLSSKIFYILADSTVSNVQINRNSKRILMNFNGA